MPRVGSSALVLAATATLLLLATPGTAPSLAPTGPASSDQAPAFDEPWNQRSRAGLAWSSTHQDALVAPLVGGAALAGWTDQTIQAYQEGRGWAAEQLDTATRTDLAEALADAFDDQVPRDRFATDPGTVPDPYVAPVATLLTAQLHTQRDAAPIPIPLEDVWARSLEGFEATAWHLGVLDRVRPTLHAAADQARIQDPRPLDPFSLVILGGDGDDTYDPRTFDDVSFQGPFLVVEPGGDDTYNVPVATRYETSFGGYKIDQGAYAIDLAGDDDYNDHVASAITASIRPHILLDEDGNDTYGDHKRKHTLVEADGGIALLLDRRGNDTYRDTERGIAYSRLVLVAGPPPAIALIGDWRGNDTYEAEIGDHRTSPIKGETHAFAERLGAFSILRDYAGDDTHVGRFSTHASVEFDGVALFIDDEGDDRFFVEVLGTSFGHRLGPGGGNRALAYYLDGNGTDTWDWWETSSLDENPPFGNDTTRVETNPDERYSVFVDCETAPDAQVPCQGEQDDVLTTIVENEADPDTHTWILPG